VDAAPRQTGLAARMRARTRELHRAAEQSGIIQAMLAGQATRADHALLLRNLYPVYTALERGLDGHRRAPGLAAIARPEVYRAAAIAADLTALCGPGWAADLPLLPAGAAYAACVDAAAAEGPRLVAHAYVRFLGDLNGGRILRRILGPALGLEPEAMTYFGFPEIADPAAFAEAYRAAIDRSGDGAAETDSIVEEAAHAFALSIALSDAVGGAAS